MYLGIMKQRMASWFNRVWHQGLMRSGMVTGLVVILMAIGLGLAYVEHGRGNFHKLKQKIATERQEAPVPHPGGREAIVVMRSQQTGSSVPQFLSATILPGRGMNILQISAYIPGKGLVDLLVSPSVADADVAMSGAGEDAGGQQSLAMGAAFEVPWAGTLSATQAQSESHGTAMWHGRTINLPQIDNGVARGGLILASPASSSDKTALPDGGQVEGEFHVQDFGAHWPSKTDVKITVLLSSRSIEMTVTARNVGEVAEPVGIGWHPRFAIPAESRKLMRLRIPAERRVEMRDRDLGVPTGSLLPVAGTPYDFSADGGAELGSINLDDCFVGLKQDLLESGPIAELSDPASGYGLRLTVLSDTIKALHVVASATRDYVTIDPQFNYPDPLGREWKSDAETGMVVLQPGETTQWKVRLELFSLDRRHSAF